MTWQYTDAVNFKTGMKVEVKNESGEMVAATIDTVNNGMLKILPDNMMSNNDMDLLVMPESMSIGRVRREIGPRINPNNDDNDVAPPWLFNQLQLEGRLTELLKGRKAQDLVQKCTNFLHPSVLHAQMTCLEPEIEDVIFRQGGIDFSGTALLLFPQNLKEKDIFYPSNLLLTQQLKCQPLCYQRGDMNSVMTFRHVQAMSKTITPYRTVHIMNTEGFIYESSAGGIDSFFSSNFYETMILWAWHLIAMQRQEPVELELSAVLKKIELSSLSKRKLTNAIYRLIQRMSYHLYFGLGPTFDPVTFNKDNSDLNSSAKELESMLLDEFDKSGLKKVEIMFSEDQVYMCETHAACWQINNNLTEIPLNLFTNNTMYIKSLHLQTNQIESVPDELFTNLPCIMDLDISSNKLTQIPDSIANCTKLLTLVIYNNNLTTLPNTLASCKCLERLDISKNLMKEFPPVITKLSKLTRLYAQNMQLTDLPEDIGNLTKLDKLGLNGNCFTSLPKSFSNLKNLTELFMNGVPWYKAKTNAIISKEHFEEHLHTAGLQSWLNHHDQDKMSIFKYFDEDTNGTLDQKELGKLNATMFNVFPRLGYKGTEPPDDDMPSGFPTELLDLPKLSYLGLQFQGFISIPEQIENLISLTTLNVSHNPNLLSIPAQLGNLPLKRLEMDGCPSLKTPPKEIRAKGFATTFAYLRRLLSGSTECMRTKLMLVGLGGAGKTSLVKALLSDDGRTKLTVGEDITDGIDICPWKVKTEEGELTFSVWDFAGQTVYYNTHQFFLSDRAVYLLLWNIRLGHEHAGLDFWLSSISVHAPKAPIFIVGTHADQVAKIELPTKAMLERYPQIAGFHYISSHTGQGVNELKTNLVEETITQQYMGEKIPGVWLGLEKSLQEIQEKCVIEYSELEKRANTSGIFDKSEVSQALQFLHELGSLQYFQNEFLKKHVVISPQWIVDVMACVVSVKDSAIKDGRLHHDDISKVWSKYPENLHWWLLRLTEEFDLTFRLADEPVNIVPCLLPEKQPEIIWPEIDKNSSMKETKMVYKFDYLPAGLFNRGQVRLHQFSDSALIWKRGSFLKKNEHICLLQQTKESKLVVRAQGARPDNVLFLVHEVFEGLIAESFHGVTYDFFIPCPDCQKQMLKDPHMFAASTIRRASELKAPFLQCLKYFHTISIIDLQSYMPPDSNLDYDLHLVQAVRGLKELKKELATDIFMSYCAQDVKKIAGDCVSTKTIVTDICKAGYKCWYKEDGSAYTSDEMARALIDSSVFVALISNDYVKDETCCNLFKYARLTLHKPIIIIAIGDGLEWKQSRLGILLVDEVFVDMRKMERYKHKLPELLKTINNRINRTVQTITSTPCFVSYCWQNSQEAINKGSRVIQGAIGAADPRDIKVYLEKNNIKCWIDVERAGNNGLFDDIAEGLINADVMVACVSDEYSKSSNCQFEFRYAVNTLKLPIVLAIVGTGNKWRASEIGILSLDCPMISFQEKSETALPKLLEQVKNYLPEKEEKKKTDNKQPENKEKDLSFQELFELAQRKFLRQIMQYAEKQDILPYPRLFVTDFIKQKHETEDGEETVEKDKPKVKETQGLKKRQSGVTVIEDDTDFHRQKYSVNILCESDEGWHSCCNPLPLPDDFGTTSLEKFSPYIARITAISKYNKHMLLNCLETEEGQKFLKWLEESPQIAAVSDFEQIYYELRQEVMQADVDRKMGSLSRCHLPNGKTIWLCEEHQKTMRVTVLSNEVLTSVNMVNEGLVTDYMLNALRDLDVSNISAKFKERKRIASGKKVTDENKDQTVIKEPEKAEKSASTSKTALNKPKAVSSTGDNKTEGPTASNQEVQNTSKRPLTRQASKACSLM
ncbi:uncharacterized protein LOC126817438 [Patella vulgata]|uniref:uncharacterized protein LOC126817438 n=1 Tax=Patella vulgata TaxID=6465 RepID=UPI0024A89447|nr:uncharacterized protein LOC126817438 [Patella vulgata]